MRKFFTSEWMNEFTKHFFFSVVLVIGSLWALAAFVYAGPLVDLQILVLPTVVLLVVMGSIIAWTTTIRYNYRHPEWKVVYECPQGSGAKFSSIPMEKKVAKSYLNTFKDALYIKNEHTGKIINKKN